MFDTINLPTSAEAWFQDMITEPRVGFGNTSIEGVVFTTGTPALMGVIVRETVCRIKLVAVADGDAAVRAMLVYGVVS